MAEDARNNPSNTPTNTVGRLRSSSVTVAKRLIEANPSRGMWKATGTAIARAPNITDLRSPGDLHFDSHGHSARDTSAEDLKKEIKTARRATITQIEVDGSRQTDKNVYRSAETETPRTRSADEDLDDELLPKVPWSVALKKGLYAIWKFISTPTGLFITVYGLNVVAWGAMLFFLLLGVGSFSKEKKNIWIEIDSQILNALFCLTGWGLFPWRFRDFWWVCVWRFTSGRLSKASIRCLAERNESWYRMRECDMYEDDREFELFAQMQTFTGEVAPPTSTWKMDFVVICMLLNSLLQVGMATFMWYYNRHNRPGFGTGLFIGLGCFSSLLAGVMCWWEGRKVKLIEGPKIIPKEEV